MIKAIGNNRGDGYIETCVTVLVFVMILVVFVNVMSFITLRQDMDIVCDNLIETATATGEFGDEFYKTAEDMTEQYRAFNMELNAEEFKNGKQVQLGKRMTVTVLTDTYVKGLGVFKIPVTIKVTKYGLSEKYWKG